MQESANRTSVATWREITLTCRSAVSSLYTSGTSRTRTTSLRSVSIVSPSATGAVWEVTSHQILPFWQHYYYHYCLNRVLLSFHSPTRICLCSYRLSSQLFRSPQCRRWTPCCSRAWSPTPATWRRWGRPPPTSSPCRWTSWTRRVASASSSDRTTSRSSTAASSRRATRPTRSGTASRRSATPSQRPSVSHGGHLSVTRATGQSLGPSISHCGHRSVT